MITVENVEWNEFTGVLLRKKELKPMRFGLLVLPCGGQFCRFHEETTFRDIHGSYQLGLRRGPNGRTEELVMFWDEGPGGLRPARSSR